MEGPRRPRRDSRHPFPQRRPRRTWPPRTRGSNASCTAPRRSVTSKKCRAHLRRGHPIKFGLVDEHRGILAVRMMRRVLGMSPSGYYITHGASGRKADTPGRIATSRPRSGVFTLGWWRHGAPRFHAALRVFGYRIGRHRVARLMRAAGLRGLAALPRRVRTTDSRHGYPIASNRLGRNFAAAAPNQIRLADLTYVPTGEGWHRLAALIDMNTPQPRRRTTGLVRLHRRLHNSRRLHSALGYRSPADVGRMAAEPVHQTGGRSPQAYIPLSS